MNPGWIACCTSLVAWQVVRQFAAWAVDNPSEARDAVQTLRDDGRDLAERIDGFFNQVPDRGAQPGPAPA